MDEPGSDRWRRVRLLGYLALTVALLAVLAPSSHGTEVYEVELGVAILQTLAIAVPLVLVVETVFRMRRR